LGLECIPALGGEVTESVSEDGVVGGDLLCGGLPEPIGEGQALIDGQGEVLLEVVGSGGCHVGIQTIRCWLKVKGYFKQSVSSFIFGTVEVFDHRRGKRESP